MNQLAGRVSEILSAREVHRFKKISTHEHFRAGGDLRPYLAAMEWANIEKAVFVPTAWPPSNPQSKENLQELLALQRQYPQKIIVFATALGQQAWLYGVQGVGPSRAGVFVNLIPVSALLLSAWLLGDVIGAREVVGIMLILAGVWLVGQQSARYKRVSGADAA